MFLPLIVALLHFSLWHPLNNPRKTRSNRLVDYPPEMRDSSCFDHFLLCLLLKRLKNSWVLLTNGKQVVEWQLYSWYYIFWIFSGWWLNQRLWKNMFVKMGSSSPKFGVKIKSHWNHNCSFWCVVSWTMCLDWKSSTPFGSLRHLL